MHKKKKQDDADDDVVLLPPARPNVCRTLQLFDCMTFLENIVFYCMIIRGRDVEGSLGLFVLCHIKCHDRALGAHSSLFTLRHLC